MRILHYYPGPHRQGGMNRYATDLALEQIRMKHEVYCLYPVGSLFPRKKTLISKGTSFRGMNAFKLNGGIPVPLLEGIHDPRMILQCHNHLTKDDIEKFCDSVRADILHIHTWMGFPVELLDEMKKRNVKIIYTAHDYFGLCPKVNFVNSSGVLCQSPCNINCSECNASAPSEYFLRLRNSSFLMKIKKIIIPLIGLKKKFHKSSSASQRVVNEEKDYDELFAYYRNLFLRCDKIHFNSNITKSIFQRFIPEIQGKILPITHGGIADHRKNRCPVSEKIRFAMFGGNAPYKGLAILLECLNSLYEEGFQNWQLDIWGTAIRKNERNINWKGLFHSEDECSILEKVDLLIVPSLWYETFGFIVPEALASGVPVLCSDTVGAQILLDENMIYHSPENLKEKLKGFLINPQVLEKENQKICNNSNILTIGEHALAMEQFYLE